MRFLTRLRLWSALLFVALLAPGLSAQLPHQSLGHLVTPTEWNNVIDAINASTSTLASGIKIATYTVTLANVLNTTSETTIASFSVPANSWTAGDAIVLDVSALEKNNKTSSGVATFKVNAGAGAQVTIAATSWSDDVTEYHTDRILTLKREGSTVLVMRGVPSGWNSTPSNAAIQGTSTPTNFTTTFTVSLKATLDAANANFYVKPQAAVAYHIRN